MLRSGLDFTFRSTFYFVHVTFVALVPTCCSYRHVPVRFAFVDSVYRTYRHAPPPRDFHLFCSTHTVPTVLVLHIHYHTIHGTATIPVTDYHRYRMPISLTTACGTYTALPVLSHFYHTTGDHHISFKCKHEAHFYAPARLRAERWLVSLIPSTASSLVYAGYPRAAVYHSRTGTTHPLPPTCRILPRSSFSARPLLYILRRYRLH